MKHRYWILFCVILISLGTFGCGDDITKKYFQAEDLPVLDEPTGSDGEYVISMAGGDGGYGGYGGELRIDTYGNTGMYVKTRTLDDTFTPPSPVWPEDLGDNGVTISEDTAIGLYVIGELAPGDLYLLAGSEYLYQFVSGFPDDYVNRATGLKVEADQTLTLSPNWFDLEGVKLLFEDDVVIEGTVETANLYEGPDKGALVIDVLGHFTMAAGSLIDTSGDDATEVGEDGGYGGLVDIDCGWEGGGGGIILAGVIDASGGNALGGNGRGGNAASGLWGPGVFIGCSYSSIVNKGRIDAYGGDGSGYSLSGNGARIDIYAGYELYNTGDLQAYGGFGGGYGGYGGYGGNGGDIELFSDASALYNSGDLLAYGGSGLTYAGSGALIRMKGADHGAGKLVNSGNLNADGGSAGNGGKNGGEIIIKTVGGDLLTTGVLSVNGGNGNGDYEYADGGNGGKITVEAEEGRDYGEGVASGLVQITNNLYLNGGSGGDYGSGGHGGKLVVRDNYDSEVLPPPVKPNELLGYALIDLTGGDNPESFGYGGNGGGVDVTTGSASYASIDYPTGAIANRVAIDASGGNSEEYRGGRGGYIRLEAEGDGYVGTTVVLNSGDIDISGGNGGRNIEEGDGRGGELYFYGHDYTENTGEINASGGDNSSDSQEWPAVAGGGGDITIYSSVNVLNTGDIYAEGGAATGELQQQVLQAEPSNGFEGSRIYGGWGGWFEIWGVASTTNRGDIYLSGGASTDVGGDGGAALLGTANSIEGPSSNSGAITVVGGEGVTEDGCMGFIWIDGFVVTPSDGTLP